MKTTIQVPPDAQARINMLTELHARVTLAHMRRTVPGPPAVRSVVRRPLIIEPSSVDSHTLPLQVKA